MDLQPVKGTRDFFPEQMRIRNWLFSIWRQAALQAGFEEYDTSVLEHEELYLRKAGEEIGQQLYNFSDKSGRRLSLRPEMTPSLARMILQHRKAISFPVKWFSIPQCFRYERMTRGRKREHYQWNLDIIGQPDEVAEAEILLTLLSACELMKLTSQEIRIFLNDRRILNALFTQIGIPLEQQVPLLILIDKRDKISTDEFVKMLSEVGIKTDQIEALQQFLQVEQMQDLMKRIDDPEVFSPIQRLMQFMQDAGLEKFFTFDLSVVRGLSYYTGIVFEMNTPNKDYRAICGGGRYDSLLSAYSKEKISAVGFGFGDVVILEFLQNLQRSPSLSRAVDVMVVPFAEQQSGLALQIARKLRRCGKHVDCNFSMKKLKKVLQQANDVGVSYTLLLLSEELEQGKVVLRNMQTREQTAIPIEQIDCKLFSPILN